MAEYQGKEVELDKPFRLPKGSSKKFGVYVKDGDKVKKVTFGSSSMEIKRDDPDRRKSFRARHKCDTAKDKTTPRYWSCKFWQANKSVNDLLGEDMELSFFESDMTAEEYIELEDMDHGDEDIDEASKSALKKHDRGYYADGKKKRPGYDREGKKIKKRKVRTTPKKRSTQTDKVKRKKLDKERARKRGS